MGKSKQQAEFGWFIPTTGDGKYIGVEPERESTADYMVQVAQTAERAGFTFALIPTGGACIDSWIVGATIAAHTQVLKPLVAMRPGLIAPVLAARMAASLDQLSGGRALINVVTGGSPQDLLATGDPLAHNHDGRYERTREFLEIVKSVWTNSHAQPERFLASNQTAQQGAQPLHYSGRFYEIKGGASLPAPVQQPHPPLYYGGSSPTGKRVAVQTADVYLMWAEPLEWIRQQIAEVEELKRELGRDRELRYGLRAQVLVRKTEEEAWKEAWEIISKVDPQALQQSGQRFSHTDAIGQKRQNELREGSKKDNYVIGPNLWSGLSTVRGGGAVLLVGTPEQVSDRILEYIDLGISSFILSGYPHLEEAAITGELLLPVVKQKLEQRQQAKGVGV
ncbi:LLM class flavin-dependent oxidoreductase [Brevibacillus parabrevis]|uniref:Alkanesulfonate monooxygenase n=1 Tax=Brevibacillus parabrevis TaxID=54914 RepID=A0A4Y3PN30_BREPA|nr:LLM class flavin-dependent oxidoreductase [Brevibacillus parabrevis]RNB94805.1 LLM class flavin-dependent oxidoreductase [Brevibacillus parabrevis]GEB32509.1 alkanesulfonate monooxygenase [Brevibacillus parabrevis]